MMERKISLMHRTGDIDFYLVRPKFWKDDYGQKDLRSIERPPCPVRYVHLLGNSLDWHRTLYGTLTFSINSFRPHIIHLEEEPDSLAALHAVYARRLLSGRSLLVLHTWQNVNRPKKYHVRRVLKKTLNCCDGILCANSEGVEVLREMGYRGRTECILQEGVDTAVFRPPEQLRRSDRFIVLYAGRFSEEKGIDTLLDALTMLPDRVCLVLVGGGGQKEELENRAASLGLKKRVTFLSPRSTAEMVDCYWNADVLVLPSLTTKVWKEQFGRVLVEAMACGLPVIGSDSGAIPEVVGSAGLLFPEGDAKALSSCFNRLADSPGLCADLRERGYRRAITQFGQEVIARKTVEFYRKIMDEKQ